jgi:tetratricopeptide (TPR) repeat protein
MSNTPYKKNVLEHSTIQTIGNVQIGDITYVVNEKEVKIYSLLTNNIPSNADHIIGRETELQAIITHLEQNKPTILVNGIGGIGKTSVATKYVANYGHQYKHIAWLTVQSSVAEAFTNDVMLLKALHIEQDVWQLIESQRLTDAFKLVIHKLNTLDKTLVVLDNANNPNDLLVHKNLFDTAKCHYLITSRTQPQEWTIVEIDHLPLEEPVNLFRKLAPSVLATDDDLKTLLSKLFFHTLLIELVAKAVENAGFSFIEMQTMIETKFIHDAQLNEDIVSTGKHGDSVMDNAKRAKIEEYIWLIFSNVKDLGDDAKQILRGMALLPVATPFDRDFLKEHLALFDVKDIVSNLSLLMETGWLEKEDNKWFKMHPLIADVVVKHLRVGVDFAEAYITYIAKFIYYDNTDINHNVFEKYKGRQLAERLSELFSEESTVGTSELLDNLGGLDEEYGFYLKSSHYRERSLCIAETIFESNNPIIAIRQSNLANVYNYLGYYDKAIELFNKAIAIDTFNYDETHQTIATRKSNLGMVYRNMELYDKAVELLEIALNIDLSNFGENHPKVAIRRSNLADVLDKLGEYERAIELFNKALESDLNNYGESSHLVARRRSNLAVVFLNLKNYEVAATLLELALSSDINNFGDDHPRIAVRKNNLAGAYNNLGREQEAKKLQKEAYINSFRILGNEHPQTIRLKKLVEA